MCIIKNCVHIRNKSVTHNYKSLKMVLVGRWKIFAVCVLVLAGALCCVLQPKWQRKKSIIKSRCTNCKHAHDAKSLSYNSQYAHA